MVHFTKQNKYLFVLLTTVLGFLLSTIPTIYNVPFTIFFPGIVLLVSPILCILLFSNKNFTKYDEIFLLIVILITICYNHYIFVIRYNNPIGTDAPVHLEITYSFLNNAGHIIFSNINTPSLGFPSLYILYTSIMTITNISLSNLAAYLHPALNMLTFLMFYPFVRNLYNSRISLLAVLLCGWEFTVFKFGFEYRTQSLAIILYLTIILLFSIQNLNVSKDYIHKSIKIILLTLTAGIMITHFVTNVIFILTLLIIATTIIVTYLLRWNSDMKISIYYIVFTFIIFIAYMLYIGDFFGGVILFMKSSFMQSFSNEIMSASTSKSKGLVGSIYGPFVFIMTWLTRVAFIIFSFVFIQKRLFKLKKSSDLFIMLWAASLFVLILYISTKGHALNPGRLYNFFAFPWSLINSYGIYYLLKKSPHSIKSYTKYVSLIFVLMLILTSLLKLPAHIIGDTEPLRGFSSADNESWNKNFNLVSDNTINIPPSQLNGNKIYCNGFSNGKG